MRTLYGASKDERIAARAIYLPKAAVLVPAPDGASSSSAAYTYDGTKGNGTPYFGAIAFWGTSAKPSFNFLYRNAAERDAQIAKFYANFADHSTRKAERAAAKAAWVNPLKAGDVLYASWGYDQTNVDFYGVTRVSGKRVWVRKIAGESVDKPSGPMSGYVKAKLPIEFLTKSPETMHVAQPSGDRGVQITIDQSRTAWLDHGQTHYESWYA